MGEYTARSQQAQVTYLNVQVERQAVCTDGCTRRSQQAQVHHPAVV